MNTNLLDYCTCHGRAVVVFNADEECPVCEEVDRANEVISQAKQLDEYYGALLGKVEFHEKRCPTLYDAVPCECDGDHIGILLKEIEEIADKLDISEAAHDSTQRRCDHHEDAVVVWKENGFQTECPLCVAEAVAGKLRETVEALEKNA